ncbi:MAG TPA: hypothetical protein PK712_07140 [Rectinema sp.]|nr:hypothetical protein [Rectinema sp.]
MSQEKLLDMHDLLLEQRWGSGQGIDLAAFMQNYGLSGNGLHSPGDYLNDSELNDVITSSDYLFQHQGDLINQSNSLLNQGKYNEASQVYDALLELDSIIDITRKCRCSAICIFADTEPTIPMGDDYYPSGEPKQPLTYEAVMEKRQSQEQLRIKCMECEYEGDSKYREDPRLTSLKRDLETAKAKLDQIKKNEEYLKAFNASGIKITPEPDLSADKIFVPMGPYEMSFSVRTRGSMTTKNYTTTRYVGSHVNNFTIYQFNMDPILNIDIAQYTGPASHDPEDPFDEYDAAYSGGFDVFYDEPIKIGSSKGRMVASFYPKKPNGRNRYIVFYKVGRDTFVQIRSKLDFDEDLSLILETIHIAKQ